MRGVVVGTGKRLDEVGQRLARLLTRLFASRDLQESKARLEEAQRVAHVGYWGWESCILAYRHLSTTGTAYLCSLPAFSAKPPSGKWAALPSPKRKRANLPFAG